jgi:hypothetical protein
MPYVGWKIYACLYIPGQRISKQQLFDEVRNRFNDSDWLMVGNNERLQLTHVSTQFEIKITIDPVELSIEYDEGLVPVSFELLDYLL